MDSSHRNSAAVTQWILITDFLCDDFFPHLGENILRYLDIPSLMSLRGVSKSTKKIVDESRRIRELLRGFRKKFILLGPWSDIQSRFESSDFPVIVSILKSYDWKKYSAANHYLTLTNAHFINIVFGDSKRLAYFWPKIQNFQHPAFVLHVLVIYGFVDCIEFLLNNFSPEDRKSHLCGRFMERRGYTPLHEGRLSSMPLKPTKPSTPFSPLWG